MSKWSVSKPRPNLKKKKKNKSCFGFLLLTAMMCWIVLDQNGNHKDKTAKLHAEMIELQSDLKQAYALVESQSQVIEHNEANLAMAANMIEQMEAYIEKAQSRLQYLEQFFSERSNFTLTRDK